jgi:hypothetical protein
MKSHLGHYEVVSELGRGGMGVVYKGYEPSLARYVAIKELSPRWRTTRRWWNASCAKRARWRC